MSTFVDNDGLRIEVLFSGNGVRAVSSQWATQGRVLHNGSLSLFGIVGERSSEGAITWSNGATWQPLAATPSGPFSPSDAPAHPPHPRFPLDAPIYSCLTLSPPPPSRSKLLEVYLYLGVRDAAYLVLPDQAAALAAAAELASSKALGTEGTDHLPSLCAALGEAQPQPIERSQPLGATDVLSDAHGCLRKSHPTLQLRYPADAEAHFEEVQRALARWSQGAEAAAVKARPDAASWSATTADDWKRRSVLKSCAISRTRRWKGSLRIRSSVDFW